MNAFALRKAGPGDRVAIRDLVTVAYGQAGEASPVDALMAEGSVVLELVAESENQVVGHGLFSRLHVAAGGVLHAAVALAPVAVVSSRQRQGIAAAMIEEGHRLLQAAGETLSIVLGDPAYYGRFGYAHDRAAAFESDYRYDALQALDWGAAPQSGRLVYAPAFGAL